MRILYIAFSCSPYHGSEDKIGWNIPVQSAKTNNVFVITREEQRQYIEHYLRENPVNNLRFYYVAIPRYAQRVLSRAPYTLILNLFHKHANRVAKEICEVENIDIIHQITPIEFRSIGDYGRIPSIKYICGPLGAGQVIPRCLLQYMKHKVIVEYVRMLANFWSLLLLKCNGIARRCAYLLFVNKETQNYIRAAAKSIPYTLCFDNGINESEIISVSEVQENVTKCCTKPIFLVAGRLVPIKGHNLLFDAIERIPKDLDYGFHILGEGPEYESIKKRLEISNIREKVVLKGAVPFEQMGQEYRQADVFVFPSLRESSGAVLLEAMAHGVPVITIDRFGGATILDNETGWLYDGDTKEEFIENLKNAIVACIENPEEVKRRGNNARKRAQQYTWEEKMKLYQKIYNDLVSED